MLKLQGLRAFFKDPNVALWRKLLVVGAVLYAIVPTDAIPDVIPVVGWLDDIGVLGIAVAAAWREVKRHSDAIAQSATSR